MTMKIMLIGSMQFSTSLIVAVVVVGCVLQFSCGFRCAGVVAIADIAVLACFAGHPKKYLNRKYYFMQPLSNSAFS